MKRHSVAFSSVFALCSHHLDLIPEHLHQRGRGRATQDAQGAVAIGQGPGLGREGRAATASAAAPNPSPCPLAVQERPVAEGGALGALAPPPPSPEPQTKSLSLPCISLLSLFPKALMRNLRRAGGGKRRPGFPGVPGGLPGKPREGPFTLSKASGMCLIT